MSIRYLALAAAALLAIVPAQAQSEAHTFEIRGGDVYLDGRLLPNAVPPGLDLAGMTTEVLEFSGAIVPVIEVDGQVFVLENQRLVRLEESSRAGQGVFMMDETGGPALDQLPVEQVTPIVEAAYMREVASRDQQLYEQMRRADQMEAEARTLADQIRSLPPGERRTALRSDLRGRLSDLLALKHQIQLEEVAFAQSRLDALRARLDEREDMHDQIVELRLRQLCGD